MNAFRRSAVHNRRTLIIWTMAAIQFGWVGAVLYVAWHFISKYW